MKCKRAFLSLFRGFTLSLQGMPQTDYLKEFIDTSPVRLRKQFSLYVAELLKVEVPAGSNPAVKRIRLRRPAYLYR